MNENSFKPILEVRNLKKHFPITKGYFRKVAGHVKAVDGVTFTVFEGKTLGLVGESGCGKTTTGHCVMRGIEPTGGKIIFHDKNLGEQDIVTASEQTMRRMRLNLQMIFQDPWSSLNPRMTLLDIVSEPLLVNKILSGKDLQERVAQLLQMVGLRPEYMRRFPHAFSGGQRQRIVIARALALNPQLIVADEPVSALDVSIQAQTLNLLQDLQKDLHLSFLFIAHDLSVVEHISDTVAVMYVGKLVETAETEVLFHHPLHPYTEALLASVPKPNPRVKKIKIELTGEVPSPANPPAGCYFHPRCAYTQPVCSQEEPQLRELEPGHFVACHRANEINLRGVLG